MAGSFFLALLTLLCGVRNLTSAQTTKAPTTIGLADSIVNHWNDLAAHQNSSVPFVQSLFNKASDLVDVATGKIAISTRELNKQVIDLRTAITKKMQKYIDVLERKECVKYHQKRSELELTHLETGIYYFHHPQATSWYEAKYICQNFGMHLATFQSEDELNHVWEAQPDKKAWSNSLWVSGSTIESESGEFLWLEGQKVNTSWLKSDKPHALSDQKEKRNMCLYLTKGGLHNTTCSFKNFFICKVPVKLSNCLNPKAEVEALDKSPDKADDEPFMSVPDFVGMIDKNKKKA